MIKLTIVVSIPRWKVAVNFPKNGKIFLGNKDTITINAINA
jgi:hypothetical protein